MVSTTEKSPQVQTTDKLFAAMKNKDWEGIKSCLTDDVRYRVGSSEPMHGSDAVVEFLQDLYTKISMQDPEVHQVLNPENQVIYEFQTHYTRLSDNKPIGFACTDIFRMEGDKVKDWRVYVDMSPFYEE